jgi:hypothetical protein
MIKRVALPFDNQHAHARSAESLVAALGTEERSQPLADGARLLSWKWQDTVIEPGRRSPPETVVSSGDGAPKVATVPGEFQPPRAVYLVCEVEAEIDADDVVRRLTSRGGGCRRLLGTRPLLRYGE